MNSIRWDEMVFANRNQMYGAYLLRKAYSRRLTLAFALMLTVVMTLLAYPSISRRFFGTELLPVTERNPGKAVVLPPPPPIELNVVIPPPTVTVPEQIRFVPPRVTEQEVVDVTPTIDELRVTPTSEQPVEGDPVFIENPVIEAIAPEVPDDFIHLSVEVQPEFPGGMQEMMKFVARNVKYPATARRIGTQGTVFVSFVVNADGTIDQIETMRGIHAACDEEAMRVIAKMPLWKPGKQNGKAVRVRFVLPIKFKLDN